MRALGNKNAASQFGDEIRRLGDRLPSAVAAAKRPETVQRIVHAAEKIFAERGLAGARTSAIARAARVNKALLYYYFRSKEDLHRFTLEVLLNELRSQAGAALEGSDSAREKLFRYVNAFFDFVVAHPNYPRLIQRQLMSRGPALVEIVDHYFRPLHDRLSATIRAGIARREFRNIEPQQTVLTLVAMTIFYFAAAPVLAELWKCDPLTPSRIATRRRAVLDFLEHAICASIVRTR
jgi:TetR/AcrR family transcriptional regulator